MKRTILLLVVGTVLGITAGVAQSNTLIDQILEQKKVGYSYAAYLVLAAAKIIPDTSTPEQALEALAKQDWGVKVPDSATSISLGQYSYLLMKAFDIPGGIMYQLLPGPRYAAREIAYLGFIQNNPSPYRSISGEEALQILNNLLSWKEE
ncbi:MAG: hypothetical protein SNJ78_11085 [Spirochaetales bacterium]